MSRIPAADDRYVADVTLRDQGDTLFWIAIANVAVATLALVVARWRSESAAAGRSRGPSS